MLDLIRSAARRRPINLSAHAVRRTIEEGTDPDALIRSLDSAELLEEYPEFWRGPCCLLLHLTDDGWVHAVWALPSDETTPVTLVTAYRPRPPKWLDERTRAR